MLTAQDLLVRWFWPHYPPDVRAAPFLHRDVDANPGGNPAFAEALADAAALFVANAPGLLGETLTLSDDGVAVFARALTRARRDAWMAQSDPTSPDGVFFQAVVHGAMFLGEVMVRAHGGRWEIRRPLWESVVHRRRGGAVSPFHWLLKSLADDAIDDASLAVRWSVHIAMDDAKPETLAVIAPNASMPPLKEPTYDLLVKYLRVHLPGLRDLGEAFPSAAEFTGRGYARLGFEPLHGGRVVAMHGAVKGETDTVEITWLTERGFERTETLPSDPGVAYYARTLNDELLEVTVAWQDKPHTHRLGLRGHG